MKPKEIIKDNQLIAEFMNQDLFYLDLFYHCSWDELMPVVEKIESIHTNDDCRHKGYELCINGKIDAYFLNPSTGETVVSVPFCDFDDNNSQPMPTIKAVWRLCVEFIKWYNQQSK